MSSSQTYHGTEGVLDGSDGASLLPGPIAMVLHVGHTHDDCEHDEHWNRSAGESPANVPLMMARGHTHESIDQLFESVALFFRHREGDTDCEDDSDDEVPSLVDVD